MLFEIWPKPKSKRSITQKDPESDDLKLDSIRTWMTQNSTQYDDGEI